MSVPGDFSGVPWVSRTFQGCSMWFKGVSWAFQWTSEVFEEYSKGVSWVVPVGFRNVPGVLKGFR